MKPLAAKCCQAIAEALAKPACGNARRRPRAPRPSDKRNQKATGIKIWTPKI